MTSVPFLNQLPCSPRQATGHLTPPPPNCVIFQSFGAKMQFLKVLSLPINRGHSYSFYSRNLAKLWQFFCTPSRERGREEVRKKTKIFLSQTLGFLFGFDKKPRGSFEKFFQPLLLAAVCLGAGKIKKKI